MEIDAHAPVKLRRCTIFGSDSLGTGEVVFAQQSQVCEGAWRPIAVCVCVRAK